MNSEVLHSFRDSVTLCVTKKELTQSDTEKHGDSQSKSNDYFNIFRAKRLLFSLWFFLFRSDDAQIVSC